MKDRACGALRGELNVAKHITVSQKADGRAKEVSLHMQSEKNMRQMVIC